MVARVAKTAATVLICGESGTGKELVARAIHDGSLRAKHAFVPINCAAIPRELLESELFGHRKGAFSGAIADRKGRFELVNGGTLFLDEIGDMRFDLQTRLLRVLSDGTFYRVGGHSAIKTHVRVIAATHQNLEQRVAEGSFREDLFHRLNVIRLRLPPLRERREDIPMLTRHFLQQSAKQLGVEAKRMSDAAMQSLQGFAFPGNVRQLENICHWLTVMAPAQAIEPKDLPPEVSQLAPMPSMHTMVQEEPVVTQPQTLASQVPSNPVAMNGAHPLVPAKPLLLNVSAQDWQSGLEAQAMSLLVNGHTDVWDELTKRFEATLIQTALAHTRGRRIDAANKLGIGRNTITRKIQELGLDG